jgi:glycine betaine/proline transport system substrate-binding protein
VTDRFKEKASVAMDYLAKRVVPGSVMGAMLVFMEEEQSDGPDAAAEFMSRHEDLWMQWVPADVAAAVKASL